MKSVKPLRGFNIGDSPRAQYGTAPGFRRWQGRGRCVRKRFVAIDDGCGGVVEMGGGDELLIETLVPRIPPRRVQQRFDESLSLNGVEDEVLFAL